jgi:hypothetical protein
MRRSQQLQKPKPDMKRLSIIGKDFRTEERALGFRTNERAHPPHPEDEAVGPLCGT